jgi:hypothetical protein
VNKETDMATGVACNASSKGRPSNSSRARTQDEFGKEFLESRCEFGNELVDRGCELSPPNGRCHSWKAHRHQTPLPHDVRASQSTQVGVGAEWSEFQERWESFWSSCKHSIVGQSQLPRTTAVNHGSFLFLMGSWLMHGSCRHLIFCFPTLQNDKDWQSGTCRERISCHLWHENDFARDSRPWNMSHAWAWKGWCDLFDDNDFHKTRHAAWEMDWANSLSAPPSLINQLNLHCSSTVLLKINGKTSSVLCSLLLLLPLDRTTTHDPISRTSRSRKKVVKFGRKQTCNYLFSIFNKAHKKRSNAIFKILADSVFVYVRGKDIVIICPWYDALQYILYTLS